MDLLDEGEWERGCRSGESTRLPPMQPGFDSRLRIMCGLSLLLVLVLAPRVFLRVLRFFLPTQKPTFPNSNSISIGIRGPQVYQTKTV